MERKLAIYRTYKDEMGVTLTKTERDKVLNHFDSNGVELLLGRKMFSIRQVEAAVRIQSWWRARKMRAWYNLICVIRKMAAIKIQRTFKTFRQNSMRPEYNRLRRGQAALLI